MIVSDSNTNKRKVCFVNVSTLSVLTGNLSYLRFPPVVNVH